MDDHNTSESSVSVRMEPATLLLLNATCQMHVYRSVPCNKETVVSSTHVFCLFHYTLTKDNLPTGRDKINILYLQRSFISPTRVTDNLKIRNLDKTNVG